VTSISGGKSKFLKITSETVVNIFNKFSKDIVIEHSSMEKEPEEEIEVGGLEEQLTHINRTLILPRIISTEEFQKLDLKYLKGLLLYGPAGTGKTLISKKIAQMLKAKHTTYVSGPAVFSKYLGDGEKNIRTWIDAAHFDFVTYREKAPLHVIIIDEIDCITRNRDIAEEASQSIILQLLTCMDGLEKKQNNIIIIGTTNRLQDIDPAFLRPGRFDIVVEIKEPDTLEKVQEIVNIYLKKLIKNEKISPSVSIERLSRTFLQKKYTGALIKGVIDIAQTLAIERNLSNIILEECDFLKAIELQSKKNNEAPMNMYV
jgi:ATP-dependent 26S proteasome regulatory subunit